MTEPSGKGSFLPAGLLALLLALLASLPGGELSKVQVAPGNALLRVLLSDPFMHAFSAGLLALLIGRGFHLPLYGKAKALTGLSGA